MPEEAEPPAQKFIFKAPEFESVNVPGDPAANDTNDPLALLKAVREHETANHSIYDQSPAPVKKQSRRLRDYLIVLVTVNLMIGGISLWFADGVSHVYLLAAFLLFNSGWSWIMLFIVDDY